MVRSLQLHTSSQFNLTCVKVAILSIGDKCNTTILVLSPTQSCKQHESKSYYPIGQCFVCFGISRAKL